MLLVELTDKCGGSLHSTTPTIIPGNTCLLFNDIARSFSALVAYLICAQFPWVGYCLSVIIKLLI